MSEKKIAIVDTSCLIALEKIALIEILCKLYKEVIIPEGVLSEFGELHLDCIKIEKVNDPLINLLKHQLNLGLGEAEVISLAFRKKHLAIIDDMRARNVAKELKINLTGTIGVLIQAERRGFIKSAYKKSIELRKIGFYLPEKLLKQLKNISK